ncbi:hypothetical protein CONLIGDRAFT_668694 [Coniochaeta ligniaria NRRL 30616]|uniref:Uncharacterized protein n=1 Tax=Coniochaeta ligniaria NRRL 30616 TaxID=1408157 RepID=A0A1J7JBU3_9PEZI|nr:hypothetical protein CONLIGDRAFT_668694 [Coniochaeta ligniaria NRRL 30616]
MSDQPPNQGPNHNPTNLTFTLNQLRMKLTESPPPSPSPTTNPPFHPPPTILRPTDTPETTALLTSPTTSRVENPLRAVYFPHWRVDGPATKKCVSRPDRPVLSVNTDVPIVSIPRFAHRYGTPWRSAAPARYGPEGMGSAEMCGWLKGVRDEAGEVVTEPFVEFEDEEGPWFEIDFADGEEGVRPGSGEQGLAGREGDVADRGSDKPDSGCGTRAGSTAMPRYRKKPSEGELEAYWSQ